MKDNMKKIWVQYGYPDDIEMFVCESYGWDRNHLFLNGVWLDDGSATCTITITLGNILSWTREED